MDDPTVGPSAPVRLQRTYEANRLEKQFLVDAYECLVAIAAPTTNGTRPTIRARRARPTAKQSRLLAG